MNAQQTHIQNEPTYTAQIHIPPFKNDFAKRINGMGPAIARTVNYVFGDANDCPGEIYGKSRKRLHSVNVISYQARHTHTRSLVADPEQNDKPNTKQQKKRDTETRRCREASTFWSWSGRRNRWWRFFNFIRSSHLFGFLLCHSIATTFVACDATTTVAVAKCKGEMAKRHK